MSLINQNNKKSFKYILIVLVGILWLFIIVRIVKMVRPSVYSGPAVQQQLSEEADFVVADTFELQIDYPDPFLKHAISRAPKKSTGTKQKINTGKSSKKETGVAWPNINYFGIFSDIEDNTSTVLVSISGKNYLMTEGDTKVDVELVKIRRDSILLSYSGVTKYIRRNGTNQN